jgi:lipopolysaccharide/colanic/teichoic acid biosynthesis glycosyltransferase
MAKKKKKIEANFEEHEVKVGGSKLYVFVKRCFDIFTSFTLLLLLSWLILILLLIKTLEDFHRPIYVSMRVGKGGKLFKFHKIRSMFPNAERYKKKLIKQGLNEADGPAFKMKDDPRITKFGKFLRKTSLDELPQLFNILKGDMSIIGPRCPLPTEVEMYPEYALDRLLVPQGLSGEWQCNGRSNTTFEEMIKMDLDYIEHKRGFWYDIGLIFKTIIVVITGKGAE